MEEIRMKNEDFPLIPAMILASNEGNDAQHILWKKVNDVIRRKCKDYELNSLPSIEEILNCKLENDPPVEILSALLGMCKKSCNLFHLVEKYPTAFDAETEDGDLPIHLLCAKDRNYEWIKKMVFQIALQIVHNKLLFKVLFEKHRHINW